MRTKLTVHAFTASAVADDVESAVRALKARDGGELQVHGSWQFVQHLQQLDLVGEYRVLAFPLVLGHGLRVNPARVCWRAAHRSRSRRM